MIPAILLLNNFMNYNNVLHSLVVKKHIKYFYNLLINDIFSSMVKFLFFLSTLLMDLLDIIKNCKELPDKIENNRILLEKNRNLAMFWLNYRKTEIP